MKLLYKLVCAFAVCIACYYAHAQLVKRASGSFDTSATLSERAFQADSFADSVGFVTHVRYNDAGNYYANLPQLIALLQAAGIRHIRDEVSNGWDANHYVTQGYRLACAAGIKLTLLQLDEPTEAGLNAFQRYVGGCVEAWEGANECDGGAQNCPKVVTWLAAQTASAKDLGIPSLGLSNASGSLPKQTGNIQNLITAQNIHTYRDSNQPPEDPETGNLTNPDGYGYSTLSWWMTNSRQNAINLPFYVTEVGYHAKVTPNPGEISEAVQAPYLARTLLWDYKSGVKRTFLYEFLDEPSSMDYGVVHADLTPKPAYTYIKNLVNILSDKGGSFVPGTLQYTISGGDSTLQHLLFQKRDGTFYLALWLGKFGWNNSTATPIGVSPQTVTVAIKGHAFTESDVFDSTGAVTAAARSGASLALPVSDQVMLLKIR